MFTGIIEAVGQIVKLEKDENNLHLTLASGISDELKVDQSVSHNGVCLTVVGREDGRHTVTSIQETLNLSNLGSLKEGDLVNLERSLKLENRLDGHLVQGHVDSIGICKSILAENGSWRFRFSMKPDFAALLISKGSVCINGVSLTVIHPTHTEFEVAIIPYTFENTNFRNLKIGDSVNLEFDVIGKYLLRHIELGFVGGKIFPQRSDMK